MAKHLTKSLFMLGLECPRKIYYSTHPDIYEDKKQADPFLQALAQGGFQVGALAKIYYPESVDLTDLYLSDAIVKTNELLQQENVTIFEAAIVHDGMAVRVDILVKNGNNLSLYEVKSKSYDDKNDDFFTQNKKNIKSDWAKYLYDVAFQTYVVGQYNPNYKVDSFLTMIDKTVVCSVNDLNQKFKLVKKNGRTNVVTEPGLTSESIGARLLADVNVTDIVSNIINDVISVKYSNKVDDISFKTKVNSFVGGITGDKPLIPRLDGQCKNCEFRCEAAPPKKSGFAECWSNIEVNSDLAFDVWNFKRIDKVLKSGRFLMRELVVDDFKVTEEISLGLSASSRQWLQVQMTTKGTIEPYVDKPYLKEQSSSWQYPLHFIDFETASVAIPFNSGRRPYEPIAFQFSHHILNKDGAVAHVGEYINVEPGIFPNFEFVRALKKQLEMDEGTIFRYSPYENTILCTIADQLSNSDEPDRESLIAWIKTITNKKESWCGNRNMIDLRDIVLKSFYHKSMRGSNSLKYVSPAVLASSTYLQDKYKAPIYGALDAIKSLNFKDQAWIQFDDDVIIKDPYQLLPKLPLGVDDKALERLFEDDEIRHGGAAMTAYAKLQFTEMSDEERMYLKQALLKYCELDTFSMVLLCEYFLSCC